MDYEVHVRPFWQLLQHLQWSLAGVVRVSLNRHNPRSSEFPQWP